MFEGFLNRAGFPDRGRVMAALVCLVLAASVAAVYLQVRHHEFLIFDDNLYVRDNPIVNKGISLKSVMEAFGIHKRTYWHPVTWLSHMLDVELFGLDPGMHHLVNAFLHGLNACLVFGFLLATTRSFWPSAAASALFALHPINVDSVAWLAERKNILSTTFWMLCLIAYARYVKNRTPMRYALVAALFGLGLLTKPMVVTLPCVLLLLDYWPLGRIRVERGSGARKRFGADKGGLRFLGEPVARLVAEKVPLLAMSAMSVVATSVSLNLSGQVDTQAMPPMAFRLGNAVVSYTHYLMKLIWPSNLTFFYPFPREIPLWQVAGSLLVIAVLSTFVARLFTKAPYLVVGWLWYLGTLVPALGIKQGGLWPQIAERFMYVPAIGLFVAVCFGVAELTRRFPGLRVPVAGTALVVVAVLSFLSWRQVAYWKNDYTLCKHGIEVNPGNFVAHVNLAVYLATHKRYDEAIASFTNALAIFPTDSKALGGLARAYRNIGRKDLALRYLKEAARYDRDAGNAHYELALYYSENGNVDGAIQEFGEVLRIDPDNALAHYNLGVLMAKKGSLKEAEDHLRKSLEINPGDTDCLNALAVLLAGTGRTTEATGILRRVIAVDPGNTQARKALESLVSGRGLSGATADARVEMERIRMQLEKEPHNTKLLHRLAVLQAGSGMYGEAAATLERVIGLDPADGEAHYNLACVYARKGDGKKALEYLAKALDKGFADWKLIETDPDLDPVRGTVEFRRLVSERRRG